MADLKVQSKDVLLSREQLKEIERHQAHLGEIEHAFTGCIDEFLSVMNRHYFNRENGYLDEQQGNLREVVAIQGKIEKIAGQLSACASDLKAYMMDLQKSIHGVPETDGKKQKADDQEADKRTEDEKEEKKAEAETEKKKSQPTKTDTLKTSPVVNRKADDLADGSQKGGEISLSLIFDQLELKESRNIDILNEISNALRKLLYDRKLIGYSKTSLVFGKEQSLDDILTHLQPIFLSDAIKKLLHDMKYISPGEEDKLRLLCNTKRELVYGLSD